MFSNIMMMSLPEYFASGTGIEPNIQIFMRFAMLALSIPVVFYSGQEFFMSAWKSLREGFLNIDAPIAFAIIITFTRSIYEIFWGSGSGYLDSMSGIIFFMLVGRMLQEQAYKSMSFDRDYKSFFPLAIKVLQGRKIVSKEVDKVKVDDVIRVHHSEIIPVDGLLSKGKALIDYSFVTGESDPVQIKTGDIIYAGGRQIAENIDLLVIKEISQSYLTSLWNKNVFKDKADGKSFIHKVSKYFTIVLMGIGVLTALYWILQGDQNTMWKALTSVFIVACPCALLLSSTYTFGNLMRIFSKRKCYLRHHSVIEEMAGIDHVVLDKTGTLTDHRFNEVNYEGQNIDYEHLNVIYALMDRSNHPLSVAIREDIGIHHELNIENFKNHPGLGIEAWFNEQHYKIGSAEFVRPEIKKSQLPGSRVYIALDGKLLGCYTVRNTYRKGFESLVKSLKNKYKISILSGDNDSEKIYLDRILKGSGTCFFNQSPQQKLDFIKGLQDKGEKVMMIGDGLNDAGALKQSDVGIAVSDSSNNFTPAADGIIEGNMLTDLDKFLKISKVGRKIIVAAFIVSILYNIAGLYFSVQGLLSPMIAAILMPLSSLTILLITYTFSGILARRMRFNSIA